MCENVRDDFSVSMVATAKSWRGRSREEMKGGVKYRSANRMRVKLLST